MSRSGSIRVGFAISPTNWLGGRNYQRNLFAALRALSDNPIVPVLFTGLRDDSAVADFSETEIVRSSMLDRRTPARILRRLIERSTRKDILLRGLLRENRVSVVSHSFQLGFHPGTRSSIKTIGWIADFQHVHMPEFFSLAERRYRDGEFKATCENCDLVVLSSECARADLIRIFPEFAQKTELLRFIASPAQTSNATSLPDLQHIYGFSTPYFLLPNQFWKHKNHRIVISALRELKRKGHIFPVLATGSKEDYRDPSFFPALMQYAADCEVTDVFRVLGKIPYDHLVGLMRHAVAFINPSQFEGWSTSVEEAKSMGKQIILSDLPVHREQDPERAFYFPTLDHQALAQAMLVAYDGFDAQGDIEVQNAAVAKFPERLGAFGETYRRVVERVIGNGSRSVI